MSEASSLPPAPHPREAPRLIGHEAVVAQLRHALAAGRLPHGLILGGPPGIGKATLAYRLAGHVLHHGLADNGRADFGAPAGSVAAQQVRAGTHPDLTVLTRPWDAERKRFKGELPVDEIRRLHGVFAHHASAGGARVAILDSADDLNRQAANALLKLLEEPPAGALLILIAHAPGRLMPTIRSRCRMIRLQPLDEQAVAAVLAAQGLTPDAGDLALVRTLAEGSPGEARVLLAEGGLSLYRRLLELIAAGPAASASAIDALAQHGTARTGEDRFILVTRLLLTALRRCLMADVGGVPGLREEGPAAAALGRFGVEARLRLWDNLAALAETADRANLDKRQALIAAFAQIAALRAA